MEEFKENIQNWVKFDNELQQLNSDAKEIRLKKQDLMENILDYSQRNDLENHTIQISDGRLRISNSKYTPPLTLQFIDSCLSDIIDNREHVDQIMSHIKSKRESKIEQTIKRYYNK